MRQDDSAQLQAVEGITAAMIILVALAVSFTFQLGTSPSTFALADLEQTSADILKVLANNRPDPRSECYESPCPFGNGSELERFVSLALGYVGPTNDGTEVPDPDAIEDFMDQALENARYSVYISNAVNQTQIASLGRTPPAIDVVGAHILLAPNWTVYAESIDDSVLLRIGEPSGFGISDQVLDPLNRNQSLGGIDHSAAFRDEVPSHAMLGTHQICFGVSADCHFFTVTPPRIFGVGSPILAGDRDNATSIVPFGDFFTVAKYHDDDLNGFFALGEPVYVDFNNNGGPNKVGPGDLRLAPIILCRPSGENCTAGSFVEAGDSDDGDALASMLGQAQIRGSDSLFANGQMDPGEGIYLADGDAILEDDERRLSRVGVYPSGSSFLTGDRDDGAPLTLTFTGSTVLFADDDGSGSPDPGEPAYLDLTGSGLTDGLEAGDFHLSPKGNPTVRSLYDVKVVAWYAV